MAGLGSMRPRDELDFIRDRVLAEIKANPPRGPLLTEMPPTRPSRTCKRGHVGADRRRDGQCVVCDMEKPTKRRKKDGAS